MKSTVRVSLLTAAVMAPAFGQIPASTTKLEFEVASVKALGAQDRTSRPQIDQQRFVYKSTLFNFIFQAYHPRCAGDCTFRGAPAWIDKDQFAIDAKMPESIPVYSTPQFMQGKAPQLSQMLQTLLEDRFKLKVHWETKELPIYEISVDKNGPKLNVAGQVSNQRPVDNSPGGTQRPNGFLSYTLPNGNRRSIITQNDTSIEAFASMLTDLLDRPVLDRTNLKGNFDFTLQYDSDAPVTLSGAGMAAVRAFTEDQLPAMLNAMRDQLGLTIKAAKGPINVLIIDHVEQPSEN